MSLCRTCSSRSSSRAEAARASPDAGRESAARPAASGSARACSSSSRARPRSRCTTTSKRGAADRDLGATEPANPGERALEPGETVAFPVGETGAHQIVNRTGDPARVLIVSEMRAPDIVVRPESDKISPSGARPAQPPRVFRRLTSAATRPRCPRTARTRHPPPRVNGPIGSPAPGRWAPVSPSSPAWPGSRPCFTIRSRCARARPRRES